MVFVDEFGERRGVSIAAFYQHVADDYCPTFADILVLVVNMKNHEKKGRLPFRLLFLAMETYAGYSPQRCHVLRTSDRGVGGDNLTCKLASLKVACSPFFLPSSIKFQCGSSVEAKGGHFLFSVTAPSIEGCRLDSSSPTALIARNGCNPFIASICDQLQARVGQEVMLEILAVPSCIFVQVEIEFSLQLHRIDFSKSLCFKEQGIAYVQSEEEKRKHDWWRINFMHL